MPKSDLEIQAIANERIEGNLAFSGIEGREAELYRIAFEAGVATVMAKMRELKVFRPILVDGPDGKPMKRYMA